MHDRTDDAPKEKKKTSDFNHQTLEKVENRQIVFDLRFILRLVDDGRKKDGADH